MGDPEGDDDNGVSKCSTVATALGRVKRPGPTF